MQNKRIGVKRSYILLAIVLWTVVALAIVSVTIYIATGGVKHIGNSNSIIKNEQISVENAQTITIDSTIQTVEILKTSDRSINITQYGNPNTRPEEMFMISTSDDGIHIYIDKILRNRRFTGLNEFRERLVVEIPETYYGDLNISTSSGGLKIEDDFTLKDVQLTCSSGSIQINESITAYNIHAETSSGSIKFNGTVKAIEVYAKTASGGIRSSGSMEVDGRVELRCTSGSVRIEDVLTANDLDAYTGSGGIHLPEVNVQSYDIESSAGSINIDRISGGGSVNTTSGGIRISIYNPKEKVNLHATSGSINITLEPSLQFTLEAQTTSGRIQTNFPTTKNRSENYATAEIGDHPTVDITVIANSGGIRIEN